MKYITYDRALRLIDKTANALVMKLDGHVEQVAYIVYKMLVNNGENDPNLLLKMCMTAYFHDFGCYKTEDVLNLAKFEIINPHAHAIYGYVFLKNFFNDEIDLDIIKYHHMNWCDYDKINYDIPSYANLLFLADRIAIQSANTAECISIIKENSGKLFNPAYVQLFLKTENKYNILNKLQSGLYKIEIRSFLSKYFLNTSQIEHFANLMCFTIDFHSNITVYHSILVASISKSLANLYSLNINEIKKITIAASLHDIGKLLIPISILEKPGKLTSDEYEIMKYHAIAGYDILSDFGMDEIRDIGALHHEKMDGSGYPFGLYGNDIPYYTRLVTIADIASALITKRSYKDSMSKEKVIEIMNKMVISNKIDSSITKVFISNYDKIVAKAFDEALPCKILLKNTEKDYIAEYSKLSKCLLK